jgi:HEAT repeat protein
LIDTDLMSDGEREKELSGLARSIGSLFEESELTLPAAILRPQAGSPAARERAAQPTPEGDPEAVADVVERLLVLGATDPESLGLARDLATDTVCDVMIRRVAARHPEQRDPSLADAGRLLGGTMATALGRALARNPVRGMRRACVDALIAIGEGASPVAARLAEDGRWFVARNGVLVLGEVGGTMAVERVVPALGHAHPRVRREALHALGKLGGEAAAQLVYGMIGDPDAEVRLAAVLVAGSLRVERALRPLLDLLDRENDQEVVIGVLTALGQLGDAGAVATIERRAVRSLLSRPPTEVRVAAYRALHAIGSPRARVLLARAADDADPLVRREVRRLLRMR